MKVKKLIKELQEFDPEKKVFINLGSFFRGDKFVQDLREPSSIFDDTGIDEDGNNILGDVWISV